jgi:hypothetical protein
MSHRATIAAFALALLLACSVSTTEAPAQGQPLIKLGACPQGYFPVCAVTKRTLVTYVNACAARGVGARVVSNRACLEDCPRRYAPVCAVDGAGVSSTFGNACEAEKSGARIVRNRGCRGVLGRR